MVVLSTPGCAVLYSMIRRSMKGWITRCLFPLGVLSPGAKLRKSYHQTSEAFASRGKWWNGSCRKLAWSPLAQTPRRTGLSQAFFNASAFGVVKDIMNIFHETTIAASKVTGYVDLLHLDSSSSPPKESNMFLNFCILRIKSYKK